MKANKVIPDNLVTVHYIWEIYLYNPMEQPITVRCLEGCDWFRGKFLKVNGQQPKFQEWLCLPTLSPL